MFDVGRPHPAGAYPASDIAGGPEPVAKLYVVSSALDYGLTIAADGGPAYAARIGWPWIDFASLHTSAAQCLIFDPRLSPAECATMPQLIDEASDHLFVFRVVDPFEESCRNHHYYRMLFAMVDRPNVAYLSAYTPAEVVKDLRDRCGRSRFLILPYAYPAAEELTLDAPFVRRRSIVLSGAQNRQVYPLRHRMRRLRSWGIGLRHRIDELPHPGYPDIGHTAKHGLIGRRYLEHLARYTFMFVSPSRCRLEFLKYGECAAAGCMPVGEAADGLPREAARALFRVDGSSAVRLYRSVKSALGMPVDEVRARAEAYRSTMRTERSAVRLNAGLDEFVRGRIAALYS